jgi:ATP-binding cassette subfamily C exporter for protease/lipase
MNNKNENFIKGKSVLNYMISDCRRELAVVGAFSVIINLLMLAPAIYMLQVYDRVLASGNKMTLLMLTLMVVWLFLFCGVVEWLRSIIVIRIGALLDYRFNRRIFHSVFHGYLRRNTSLAPQALSDLTLLRQFASGNALFALFDTPWFVFYLCIIFLLHSWLGGLAMAGAAIVIFLAWLNQRLTTRPFNSASELAATATRQANSCLNQAEVIEAMGMLSAFYQRWLQQHQAFLHSHNAASEKSVVIATLTRYSRLALQSLMLGMGAWLVLQQEITAGMMIAGSILSGRVMAPVDQLIAIWKPWNQAREAWRRLDMLLNQVPEQVEGLVLPAPSGVVQGEGLSVKAPGVAGYMLHNLSFNLQPGEVLGVLGSSGSGKSTLARLLVGVLLPSAGVIRLDGADIYQWDRQLLGPFIGYLPQDIQLFSGTVAENIARFLVEEDEMVVVAARAAGVHDAILRLPMGYDTPLGDGGYPLSGGQKQRIALARALYGEPRLIVLDEPDASLDDEGRQALVEAIRIQKQAQRTVVVISHNMGLMAYANKLLVLEAGRCRYFGSAMSIARSATSHADTNQRQRGMR